MGNQLMQQGEYEQAIAVFEVLLRQNPENIPVIDRKATALIQLMRYDEAITLLTDFTERNPSYPNLSVRVGEIYHMDGQRDKARAWWRSMIDENPRNVQVYRLVAESMVTRREHEAAARLYIEAREVMQNSQMFGFDIAQNFTAAGMYEETMQEYSHLITVNPGFMNAIQRQIARYEDDFFKDTGVLAFEEASRNLRPGTDAWVAHRQMLIWLYNERELYRRSFTTAVNLEERIEDNRYPVFDLGRRLASLNQFELAADAFSRYTSLQGHELYVVSRQELASLYIRQAKFLRDYNKDFGVQAETLYQNAYDLLSSLHETHRNYRGISEVYARLVELSLEYLKDLDKAIEWLGYYDANIRTDRQNIQRDYLQGRIHMMEQDFSRARITLTRANRAAGTGDMAERTRYFLSLNDFFAGDFDFARLQLRSLQRQTTSYYANDALRLRAYLQQGVQKEEVNPEIVAFSKAKYEFASGNYIRSMSHLAEILDFESPRPLLTDAVLLAAEITKMYDAVLTYSLLTTMIESGLPSDRRERLLWERVRLADAFFFNEQIESRGADAALTTEFSKLQAKLAPGSKQDVADGVSRAFLIRLYEDLIIDYPSGFYAGAARERIREVQRAI